jgi:hypothetical protein
MRPVLSKRDTRALFRGLIVMGTIIGLAKGVPAWRNWEGNVRRNAGSTLHHVALVEAGVRQLAKMRDSIEARRLRFDSLSTGLFEAATVQEATAALAVHVSETATVSEVKVNTLQLHADSAYASDGFARIGVRLNATSDVTGLAELLRFIEGDSLLLTVLEMNVTQPEPAAPDSKVETLHFELLIEGLAMHPRVRAR